MYQFFFFFFETVDVSILESEEKHHELFFTPMMIYDRDFSLRVLDFVLLGEGKKNRTLVHHNDRTLHVVLWIRTANYF